LFDGHPPANLLGMLEITVSDQNCVEGSVNMGIDGRRGRCAHIDVHEHLLSGGD
jgi:hypothetical protein